MNFAEQLRLARQEANQRHKNFVSKPNKIDSVRCDQQKYVSQSDEKSTEASTFEKQKQIKHEELISKYGFKETIGDQILCSSHSSNNKSKCINCCSKQLLSNYKLDRLNIDTSNILLTNAIFNYLYNSKQTISDEDISIENLVNISRCSNDTFRKLKQFQSKKSLQYGEITFYSFVHILLKCYTLNNQINKDYNSTGDENNCTFVDLGSGIGKAMLIANLVSKNNCFTSKNNNKLIKRQFWLFSKCIGIELITKIHNSAVKIVENCPKNIASMIDVDNIEFINGDIFDRHLLNKCLFNANGERDSKQTECKDGDSLCKDNENGAVKSFVVFIASTAFDHNMMNRLSILLNQVFETQVQKDGYGSRINVWIITLSHCLNNKIFQVKHQEMYRMSWGNVMVYFQTKMFTDVT